MSAAALLRHQNLHALSSQFLSVVAEQLLRACIHELNCSVPIHQYESVWRSFKKKTDVVLLNDQTLNKRIEQDDDSHHDAVNRNEQEQLHQFSLAQGPGKIRRDKQVPRGQSAQDCCDDAWPKSADERGHDDGGKEGDEWNPRTNVLPDEPAHEHGESDHSQRQAVGSNS